MSKMDNFTKPKTIAVIGASDKIGSVGNELLLRLTEGKFTGKIFGVNPKYNDIMGIPTLPNVCDIPIHIDLAVIAVPASVVLNVLQDCAKAKINSVVIISAGFKETGQQGAELEKQIVDFAKANNISIIGPNCLGIINTSSSISMNASFAPLQPIKGNIGFATQSGALASGIINLLPNLRIGLSQMISLGNQADINSLDVLEGWENDDNIKQIILYLEGLPDNIKFREIATRVASKKPLLVIKSGRSSKGAQATASHTGSLAGDDTVAKGLLASCGIIREYTLRDLFDTAQVFSKCPIPQGDRVAILTNAGGPGILATDSCEDFGLPLAQLSETEKVTLRSFLSPQASVKNPIDVIASAPTEHFIKSAELLLKSKNVDMLMVIYLYITGKNDITLLKALEELKQKYPHKPIVVSMMTTPSLDLELTQQDWECTLPIFSFMSSAIRGLARLNERRIFLNNLKNKTSVLPANKTATAKLIQQARQQNITKLTTYQSLEIFKNYGLPLPSYALVQTLPQAKEFAKKFGYPCVLKISSRTATHKTDVGGVITNIKTEEELSFKWQRLLEKLAKAKLLDSLDGIVIMQQINGSNRELVAGVVNKGEKIGYQMMFGLGGVFVETLKEVTFRPCPLTINDAHALIYGTKAKNILGEVRGSQATDINILTETLLRLNQIVLDFPEIIELDANPLMIDDKGKLYVVDARIILGEEKITN